MNNIITLTARELANRWHKSTNTLANWRNAGKGPSYIQPGGKRCPALYPLSEVESYEAKHKINIDNN